MSLGDPFHDSEAKPSPGKVFGDSRGIGAEESIKHEVLQLEKKPIPLSQT